MSKILIGADPEVFVSHNGKLVSAHGLIKGNKHDPFKVDRGAVQVDGMALEFNINPAASEAEWMGNINGVLDILASMVPEHKLECIPTAVFGLEYIRAQPEEAKELGCDPDYNAYTVAVNPRPNGETDFRTGAGHIHFGLPETGGNAPVEDKDYIGWLAAKVRELDFYLGLPSLFYDADIKRRELYGKAGAFRPKKYGMEYRTLSNQWLGNDTLKRWAYKASVDAMERIESGVSLFKKYGTAAQQIVNKSDKNEAARIIKAEGIILPEGIVL